MKEGARLQAVIELLEIFQEKSDIPFDRIVHTYLKERRYMGSKDRQEVVDKAYAILRRWFSYHESLSPYGTPRLMVFLHEKHFPQSCPYGPEPITLLEKKILKESKSIYKDYLPDFLKDLFTDPRIIPAMREMPSVDLRVNTLKATREDVLKTFGFGNPTHYSPYGIRLKKRTPLNDHQLWKDGFVDIQDEGSQLAAILCDVEPSHRVLDLCAGAGGKTLALSAIMKNKGTLIGTDIAQWRLDRAKERIRKAGAHNVCMRPYDENWLSRQKERFDRVLVDAPCSGSGTWRRNPDIKVRTTKEHVQELVELQKKILKKAVSLVCPRGRLIYVTCSLFRDENEKQVENFLENHSSFRLLPIKNIWEKCLRTSYPGEREDVLHLNPLHHHTDGFFIAILEKQ